eukprot:COSAG06_NODE_2068_length_7675_cov_8.333421_5_plen_371_part_00
MISLDLIHFPFPMSACSRLSPASSSAATVGCACRWATALSVSFAMPAARRPARAAARVSADATRRAFAADDEVSSEESSSEDSESESESSPEREEMTESSDDEHESDDGGGQDTGGTAAAAAPGKSSATAQQLLRRIASGSNCGCKISRADLDASLGGVKGGVRAKLCAQGLAAWIMAKSDVVGVQPQRLKTVKTSDTIRTKMILFSAAGSEQNPKAKMKKKMELVQKNFSEAFGNSGRGPWDLVCCEHCFQVVVAAKFKMSAQVAANVKNRDMPKVLENPSFAQIEAALERTRIPVNKSRKNVKQTKDQRVTGMCLGIVSARTDGEVASVYCRDRPNLTKTLVNFGKRALPDFHFTSIQVNKNYLSAMQ